MLIISDLHWRTDCPSWRKEPDYARDVLRPSLGSLLDTGEPVIVCGDVFHRSADFEATYDLFTFLKERGAVLYAVRGQHDMTLHSGKVEETGFNLLVKAGLIVPLGPEEPTYIDGMMPVYGVGWGEEVPTIGTESYVEGSSLILIAHVSVSHGDAVIPGATTATAFREKAKAFKLVFTGDNHRRFHIPGLYNAGCFHQMSSDLADQKPIAWHVTGDGEPQPWAIVAAPPPLVDESYMARQSKGKAEAAGAEFVKALAEARQSGGGDVFMAALKGAAAEAAGSVKTLLDGVIKLCIEESPK